MRAIYLTVFIFAGMVACTRPAINAEPGVSLQLAQHRGATISDIEYELHFDIPAEVDGDVQAKVGINFNLNDNSLALQLDFREDAEKIHVVLVNGELSDYRFVNEHIVIPPEELVVGDNIVNIQLSAGVTSLNRNPGYLYTLFVPDRARTAFPLFDQPDLKATFELSLVLPPGWVAMSNAPVDEVMRSGLGNIYQFEKSDLISSYLFSFVAGEFETITREVDGRLWTMLHRESDEKKVSGNIDEIFNLHAVALEWLEEYTGIDYPYQKFGFALIPAFQYGGMEHVGAIQYRASSLFLDEAPSETQVLARAGLIAHETAHMWFGNLVTMEWFNDVWTKEVFASVMASKIVSPTFPDLNHDLNFLVRHYPNSYAVDRTEGANPIRQQLANLNEAGQMYGAIIYNKAPIMMRKLESMIGEELFREGIQEYLQTFAFDNATWPALINILDRKTDADLGDWSEAWVHAPGLDAINRQRAVSIGEKDSPMRYGHVPVEVGALNSWDTLGEVQRAALLINLYERLLGGNGPTPEEYFGRLIDIVQREENQLILNLVLEQLREVFWKLMNDSVRDGSVPMVEHVLWESMSEREDPSIRKVYFDAYIDIALTPEAINRIFRAWSGDAKIHSLPLSEDDKIRIAQILAIKLPEQAECIIARQMKNTENPDNVRKLAFISPSLSPNRGVRDAFFQSLADDKQRQTESWVLDALANLHHPLRTEDAERYILPSLELLQKIHVTGDIFFPKRWLDETLRNHRSGEAVATVRRFLAERPDYNEQLRMKILQSADMLFRANGLLTSSQAN